jgi:transposase
MSGVPKIEVRESIEELKLLMKQQKTGLGYAKVQSIYLLKIRVVENINYLAVIIGRGESTIHRWLELYKRGGLSLLLEEPPKTGRPKKIDIETVAQLQQELSDPQGFVSYREIQLWLLTCQDLEINYSTIYKIVRYELQSKLKTPRPTHEKQAVGVVEAFQKFLPQRIKGIVQDIRAKRLDNREIAYWCQDETRIGFRSESGKIITLKGVKPQQTLQWHYDYYYIYGLVEPIGGKSFFYEFSHFNSDCMEIFLEKFQAENTDKIHIVQLDNASIHTAKKLNIPENVILLFQPPYCPEVNPIERVWQYIKFRLRSLWFINLDDVKKKVAQILNSLRQDIIISLAGWDCFQSALSL